MKKINNTIPYVAMMLSFASIFVSFHYLDLGELFTIDWSILKWMLLAFVVFAVFCICMTCYLMMQSHRILNVYISYPFYGEKEVAKLKDAITDENVTTSSDIPTGTDTKGIKKMITRSHVCFIAIGKTMPSLQKEEYKMMRTQGKNIYFIAIDENGIVPSSMSGRVPLYINDEKLNEKICEILKDNK